MKNALKVLSVALLLTTMTPAHGMFRGGFMAAKAAVKNFKTKAIYSDGKSFLRRWCPRIVAVGAGVAVGEFALSEYGLKTLAKASDGVSNYVRLRENAREKAMLELYPTVSFKAKGTIKCTTDECRRNIANYAAFGKTWAQCVKEESQKGLARSEPCRTLHTMLYKTSEPGAYREGRVFLHDLGYKAGLTKNLYRAAHSWNIKDMNIKVQPNADSSQATFTIDSNIMGPALGSLCSMGQEQVKSLKKNSKEYSKCIKENKYYRTNPSCAKAPMMWYEPTFDNVTFDKVDVGVKLTKKK